MSEQVPTRARHKDLQGPVHELKTKGITLAATEQPIDTRAATGKAFLDMLGVFAEFEMNLRRERQLEGIALVKTRGVYKGQEPRDENRASTWPVGGAASPRTG